MTRELIIKNIMVNYKKYGVTEQEITDLIDRGLAEGMNYDCIYMGIRMALSNVYGEEFYCTSSEMVKAFDITEDEMDGLIKEAREELLANGEDPDEYFRTVQSGNFWM